MVHSRSCAAPPPSQPSTCLSSSGIVACNDYSGQRAQDCCPNILSEAAAFKDGSVWAFLFLSLCSSADLFKPAIFKWQHLWSTNLCTFVPRYDGWRFLYFKCCNELWGPPLPSCFRGQDPREILMYKIGRAHV